MRTIIYLSIFLLTVSSCTIMKRQHLKGYSIHFNKNYIGKPKAVNSETNELNVTQSIVEVKEDSTADCDILRLNNGEEISAKIIWDGPLRIRYKDCNNQNGETKKVKQKDAVIVRNYTPDSDQKPEKDRLDTLTENTMSDAKAFEMSLGAIDRDTVEVTEDDKNISAFLYLFFFAGLFGIHRMYLGYWFIGFLYFFTLGFLGIGWLVDLILFFTGNLHPKKGRFVTTD